MKKTNQFISKLLLILGLLLTLNPTFAQLTPLVALNSQLQGFIEFKSKKIFGELSLQIPLPPGNWTVRLIESTKSTHQQPAEGFRIFLDQVENKKVQTSLLFYVYPNDNKNWSTGEDFCFGSLLSRERGSAVNGYCHSLKNITFMTNAKSDWQGKVRTLWRESGITYSSKALTFDAFFEQRGKFTVYSYYAVSLPAIGLPDELTKNSTSQTVDAWWKENEKSAQVIEVVRWYETYSALLAAAVSGEKPASTPTNIVDSAIPKLQRLVLDLQLAKRMENLVGQSNIAVASNPSSDEIEVLLAEREKLATEALLERTRRRELEEKLELTRTKPTVTPTVFERRVALVVGNAGYKNIPLSNPVNDALDISASLKNLGFEVTTLQDVNLRKLRESTRVFESSVASADVALIFYAGHAVEAKGKNFVIPIDADVTREYELEDQAYDAQQWLAMLGDTRGKNAQRVNIVILDACRDNPVSRQWRSSSSGLGRMDAPSGTLLVYSTSPGKVASDGPRGQRNSPFTKSLLRSIQTPNLPVEQVLKDVRRQVLAETKGEQVPWENSSLIGDFVFKRQQ